VTLVLPPCGRRTLRRPGPVRSRKGEAVPTLRRPSSHRASHARNARGQAQISRAHGLTNKRTGQLISFYTDALKLTPAVNVPADLVALPRSFSRHRLC